MNEGINFWVWLVFVFAFGVLFTMVYLVGSAGIEIVRSLRRRGVTRKVKEKG